MAEESSIVSLPNKKPVSASKSRSNQFGYIYSGFFKDKTPSVKAAGILTYAEGDNVAKSIRQPINASLSGLPQNIEKYSLYRYPGLGEIRYHYGHASDPKYYLDMTHGMKSDDKSFVS
jgi:hypothetical protein